MTDELLEEALAELGDVVQCRCDEAYRDRDLQDPQCQCDSMDAVRTVIARIEWLERERDALFRKAALAEEWRDSDRARAEAAEAKLAEAVKMLDERDREYNRLTNGMIERHAATVATLTKKMEAMRGAAEEAAEVIHKAYVSATMEAVNAGPSHPLKDNIDKWRVRCLRAEEALRAALTTENQTNG